MDNNNVNYIEFINEDGTRFYEWESWCNELVGSETVSRWIANKRADIDAEHMHYYRFKHNKEVIPHHILSVSEFAAVTGRNEKTVRNWVKKSFVYDRTINGAYGIYIFVEETVKKLDAFIKKYRAK